MTFFPRIGLWTTLTLGAVALALTSPGLAKPSAAAPKLPQTMPVPAPNPEQPASQEERKAGEETGQSDTSEQQTLPASPPKPEANPEEPAPKPDDVPGEPRSAPSVEAPQSLPIAPPAPDERPDAAPDQEKPDAAATKKEDAPAPKRADGPRPVQGPPLPPSLVGAQPAEELACRAELKKLGALFEDRSPESGEDGCSMPYPVAIGNFGTGIKVEPPVLANCAVSLGVAKFLQTTVKQAADKHLKASITAIANGSGYICRPRHGTQKLSEHALGNAIDIMSFTLSDGRSVVVEKTTDKAETDFLAEIRAAACGPFTTVLGPGADADHANHFHLDLADRRPGATFCQ